MKRWTRLATLLVLSAALLAACGSDESGDGTTSGPGAGAGGDVEAFLAAVDATCVEHAVAVNELSERLGVPQGFKDAAAYDQARADAAAEQADAAVAIDPPPDLAAEYELLAASYQDYAAAYQENADLAKAGEEAAWEASTEARRELGNEQLELAEGLGLQACARMLSAVQETAVMEVTERVLTGSSPVRSCEEDITAAYQQLLGGRRGCVRELFALREEGVAPEFLFFTGVDGVLASANVNYTSTADAAPKYLIYDFVWDEAGERWLMDSSFVAGPAVETADSGGA